MSTDEDRQRALAAQIGLPFPPQEDWSREYLRVRRVPRGHTTSPFPFIEGMSLETDEPGFNDGIWHVTTNLFAVLRDGLKPRRETGIVALGGGPMNMAPDKISAVTRHDAAVRLYEAIRFMLEVARGNVPTAVMVKEFRRQNDWGIMNALEHEDYLRDVDELDGLQGLEADFNEILNLDNGNEEASLSDPDIRFALDNWFPDGKARYDLFTELEKALSDWVSMANGAKAEADDCDAPVGFTAPWNQFVRLDPRNVAILELSVNRRARTDIHPSECELRFYPQDVHVVGWERPAYELPR